MNPKLNIIKELIKNKGFIEVNNKKEKAGFTFINSLIEPEITPNCLEINEYNQLMELFNQALEKIKNP